MTGHSSDSKYALTLENFTIIIFFLYRLLVARVLDDDKTGTLLAVRADCVLAHNVMGYQRVEIANVQPVRAVVAINIAVRTGRFN